jgi:lipopolysaccharide export LptBFGC system permease protein LptF
MPRVSPFSPKVIKKAAPAIVLTVFLLITLIFVAEYTEAIYLVILLWIILPVMAVQLFRKIRNWLNRRKNES